MPIKALAARFLELTAHEVSKNVQAARKLVLADFGAFYAGRAIDSFKKFDLIAWLHSHPEWKSNWTRKGRMSIVKRLFNWAVDMGLLEKNPFAGRYNLSAGPRTRPVSAQEFQKLLRHTTGCFRRVLIFLRFTGARPAEAISLTWEDVDLARGTCLLVEHKTGKKTGKPRLIVLPDPLRKLLVWLKARRGKAKYVFLNHRRRPWKRHAIVLRFKRLRKACGLPMDCKLYGIRHAFGTQAVKNGVAIKDVSELMGHTTTRMTEYYVHLAGDVEHLREAANQATQGHGQRPER